MMAMGTLPETENARPEGQAQRSQYPVPPMRGVELFSALVLAVTVSLAACGSPSAALHDLTGVLVLVDRASGYADNTDCAGQGGYVDITGGAPVTVRDGEGTVIGTGNLDNGVVTTPGKCDFTFSVAGLPESAFYSIEVGHRGEVVYSAADMAGADWAVTLTLGE